MNKFMKNNESFESIAMMLMIVVGIAVIIGYLGTRYVVYPVFLKEEIQNEDVYEEEVDKEEVSVVPTGDDKKEDVDEPVNATVSASFCVYHVQLGNFQSRDNAETLIKELGDKKIEAYLLEGDGYKVVTMPVTTYKEAEEYKNVVKEYSKDAFVLKRNVIEGEDEFVQKILEK